MSNIYKVKARENWYGSLENAYIQITTPKGTLLTIDKLPNKSLKNRWLDSPDAVQLVWSVYDKICEQIPLTKAFTYEIEMSKDDLLLFAKYSDKQINF